MQPVTLAVVESPQGVLLQQRPPKGLLAGLWQPPLWEGAALSPAELCSTLTGIGLSLDAAPLPLPEAKHIFSHIEWQLTGWRVSVPQQAPPPGFVWAQPHSCPRNTPCPAPSRLTGPICWGKNKSAPCRPAASKHMLLFVVFQL